MPGVKVVGYGAFDGCYALAIVECDKLERIERCAFYCCNSLGSINLPSAKIIEASAFWNCYALMKVEFGKELESIARAAFYRCTSLQRITIPLKDGMITHENIFRGCKKMEHVDLVEGEVLRDTIAALLLEEWRNDMKDKLGAIDRSLPTAPVGDGLLDVGEKAEAVHLWIRSVLRNIIEPTYSRFAELGGE